MARRRSGSAQDKIPVIATVKFAFTSVFENLADVLRCTWLWIILTAPLLSYVSWLRTSHLATLFGKARNGGHPVSNLLPIDQLPLTVISQLLLFIAVTSVAVAWHRRIILDEKPPTIGTNVLTASFWRYIGVGIAIFLIGGIPFSAVVGSVVLYNLSIHPDGNPFPTGAGKFLLFVIAFALWLFAVVTMVRLSLLLPARAAGDIRTTFKEVWDRTRGNTWRIIVGLLLCAVPTYLVQMFFFAVVGVPKLDDPDFQRLALPIAIVNGLGMAAMLFLLPIAVGFISQAYLFLFDPKRRLGPLDAKEGSRP